MAGRSGRSGRPPKSSADKALAGNPGKRAEKLPPQPETAPVAPAQSFSLVAPSWLPEAAQDEWRRCAPELHRTKLLKPLNEMAFAIYCMNAAIVQFCAEKLKKLEDDTYETKSRHGDLRRISPDFKAMREVQKDMIAFILSRDRVPWPVVPPARSALWHRKRGVVRTMSCKTWFFGGFPAASKSLVTAGLDRRGR